MARARRLHPRLCPSGPAGRGPAHRRTLHRPDRGHPPHHHRPARRRHLRALRRPPRLRLPRLRGDLPGRHLPVDPGRTRRRERRPGDGGRASGRVRHPHRPLLRTRPHPSREPHDGEGAAVSDAPRHQPLPTWAPTRLHPPPRCRRPEVGAADLPGLLRPRRPRRLERLGRRTLATHHHHPHSGVEAARAGPRRPVAGLLRQGRRIPTPRRRALPRPVAPRPGRRRRPGHRARPTGRHHRGRARRPRRRRHRLNPVPDPGLRRHRTRLAHRLGTPA